MTEKEEFSTEKLWEKVKMLEEIMLIKESQKGGLLYAIYENIKGTAVETIIREIGRSTISREELAEKIGWKSESLRVKIASLDFYPFTLIESRKEDKKIVYFLTKAGLKILELIESSGKVPTSLWEFLKKENVSPEE